MTACALCRRPASEVAFSELRRVWCCLSCFLAGPTDRTGARIGPTSVELLEQSLRTQPPVARGPSESDWATSPEGFYSGADDALAADPPPSMPTGLVALTGARLVSPLARALGIVATYGELFPSILPGDDGGAVLHATGRGHVMYRSVDRAESVGLGEVRAAVACGQLRTVASGRLSPAEAAIWHDRLRYEAGLLELRTVALPQPATRSEAIQRVADGWELLVRLRDEGAWGALPYAFARCFVMAWCGVTDKQARVGVEALLSCGAMICVRPQRRPLEPALYAPPAVDVELPFELAADAPALSGPPTTGAVEGRGTEDDRERPASSVRGRQKVVPAVEPRGELDDLTLVLHTELGAGRLRPFDTAERMAPAIEHPLESLDVIPHEGDANPQPGGFP